MSEISYKELEKDFNSKGFNYKQIYREDDLAIYEQRPLKFHSAEPSVRYEAIRIKRHNGYNIGGVDIPPSEVYPSSSSWGRDGYTYITKSDAIHIGLAKLKKTYEDEPVQKSIVPIKFPEKPFTVKGLAELNNIPLSQAYAEVRDNKRIKEYGRQKKEGRGKPSVLYNYV